MIRILPLICWWVASLFFSFSASAQLAAIPFDVDVTVHYGAGADGIDLTGYVTYDVYLVTQTPTTRIVVISGGTPASEALADTLGEDGILTPDALDLFIHTPCGTFQHENSGWNVAQNNCNLQTFLPSMAWDSFLTLKYLCSPTPTAINNLIGFVQDINSLAAWENDNTNNFFDGGTSLVIDNGALFGLPTDISTLPVNNRLLVMRITTCGDLETCFNADVYENYTPGGDPPTTERICLTAQHPCIANPMDITPLVGSATCFGEGTEVSLDGGGNGPIDYKLFAGSTVGGGTQVASFDNQPSGVDFANVPTGDYYITMIDSVGCRDTTAVFTVAVPDPLQLEATLLQGVLCFGETTGSIEVNCSGGSGVTVLTLNGTPGTACGETLNGLACGNYTFVITDEQGCSLDTTVAIVCPTQLTGNLSRTNIPCFGLDNGTITGTVTGGTGNKVVDLILNGESLATQNGTGTVNVNFTGLDSGVYTVLVTDANGCTWTQEFTITEPALFVVEATATPVSCFGECDGVMTSTVTGGGTVVSTVVVPQGGGTPVNANALCAGNFAVNVTDNNNCTATANFTVDGPDDIVFDASSTNLTCFGLNDGTIDVTNVEGGFGGYTYDLVPNLGLCIPPCSGESVSYLNVPAGNYTIVITDQGGCEKTVTGIQIQSPPAININLTTFNVTCFGANNGEVLVSGTGGTGQLRLSPDNINLPATVTDLSPGTYEFIVVDENGCLQPQSTIVTEPDLLVAVVDSAFNVSCGGSCDGRVDYEVSGGTVPYAYFLTPQAPPAVADGNIDDLCADDYVVLIQDNNNCETELVFSISEPTPLELDVFLVRPTCTGMFNGSAQVTSSGGTGQLTTIFSPSGLDITELSDTSFALAELGEQVFFIDLFDSLGCSIRDTVDVVPSIITDMVITMFSSQETCFNTKDGTATAAVQNGNLPISFEWNDPETQTSATAVGLSGNQEYTVIVTDAIGCRLTESVFVQPTQGCFFIANVITPNGDGANDTWVLGGLELYPGAKIQVFNRWGQVVFESTGYSVPWAAIYNDQLLPMADYYYVIDYSDEFEPITGTVTIKY